MITHKQFLKIASTIAESSKCENAKVGAILVKDGRIISIGYNGTPSGWDNECECDGITKKEVLHAEANAIAKCATSSESSKDSELYTTLSPCVECAKLIIQSKIKAVYYKEKYKDTSGIKLLKKSSVKVFSFEK